MSYDLNFYKKEDNPVDKAAISGFLSEIPYITKETEDQWLYQNENTGVYFIFEYFGEGEDEETEEEDFGELIDTNFGFSLNFIRPYFFGLEAFEVVEKLMKKFDLYILNPQEEAVPMKYPKGKLMESWKKSNEVFSKSNFKKFDLKYLDLEKSIYSWKFCYNRDQLQAQLGDAYFVPNIFYLNKKGTDEVELLSIWPENSPYVLPRVDYVLIYEKRRKLFRSKIETGLVKYETIIEKLGDYFEDKGDYKIIHPENTSKIKSIFNSLEFFAELDDYGKMIPADKIVNYKDE